MFDPKNCYSPSDKFKTPCTKAKKGKGLLYRVHLNKLRLTNEEIVEDKGTEVLGEKSINP